MSNRTRNIAIGATALVVVCVIAFVAFIGFGSDDDSTASTTPAPVTTVLDPANTTGTTGLNVPVTADPTATIPVGVAVEPGSVESTKQDLSPECTAAVAALRDLMTRYDSGLLVDVQADMDINDAGIQAAQASCSPAEFDAFYNKEYVGWNNGETGFVPPATDAPPATQDAAPPTT